MSVIEGFKIVLKLEDHVMYVISHYLLQRAAAHVERVRCRVATRVRRGAESCEPTPTWPENAAQLGRGLASGYT